METKEQLFDAIWNGQAQGDSRESTIASLKELAELLELDTRTRAK